MTQKRQPYDPDHHWHSSDDLSPCGHSPGYFTGTLFALKTEDADQATQQGPEKLMTQKQVAEWLGFSTATISKWTQEGRLPHLRMGLEVRYEREKILAAMEPKRVRK